MFSNKFTITLCTYSTLLINTNIVYSEENSDQNNINQSNTSQKMEKQDNN